MLATNNPSADPTFDWPRLKKINTASIVSARADRGVSRVRIKISALALARHPLRLITQSDPRKPNLGRAMTLKPPDGRTMVEFVTFFTRCHISFDEWAQSKRRVAICEIEKDKSERITANYGRICLNNERANESTVMPSNMAAVL
ncbi:hypothetical protein J6590_034074 [Homalodisca vitripennis]|nr:hypothetical protein J6590_034074 [Homalodisca vitripennis]